MDFTFRVVVDICIIVVSCLGCYLIIFFHSSSHGIPFAIINFWVIITKYKLIRLSSSLHLKYFNVYNIVSICTLEKGHIVVIVWRLSAFDYSDPTPVHYQASTTWLTGYDWRIRNTFVYLSFHTFNVSLWFRRGLFYRWISTGSTCDTRVRILLLVIITINDTWRPTALVSHCKFIQFYVQNLESIKSILHQNIILYLIHFF